MKNRGYGFLIPLGKMLTQHEEKNDVRSFLPFPALCAVVSPTGVLIPCFDDRFSLGSQRIQADDGSEVDESARSSHPESPTDEGEGDGDGDGEGEGEGEEDEDGGMDLDAELEDMDEDIGNTTAETEDLDDMDEIEAGELDE